MTLILVSGLLLFNLLISAWNAYATGKVWTQAKKVGGWHLFSTWMVAAMSALGFTWTYLVLLTAGLLAFDKISVEDAEFMMNLGYLIIIPGVIFSGMIIGIQSWVRAAHNRTLGNMGLAGYNTFANAHNIYRAIEGIPAALEHVFDYLSKSKGKWAQYALLVLIVLMLGILTTYFIIQRVSSEEALKLRAERFSLHATQR